MSGGTDSSVAAALLKSQGYEVVGVTMRVWPGNVTANKGNRHGCYGPEEEQDIHDAYTVAMNLGIPLHIFDLTREYESEVLEYFRQEYMSGRTPNPCIKCNRKIKFDALVEKARASGIEFDYLASGHYARTEYDENSLRYLLKKGKDLSKDQSYFLSSLSQAQLRQLLLPLGSYTKGEVRKLASCFGLDVKSKSESQDFFSGGYASLIGNAAQPGPILDQQGNFLGQHRGIQFYTIGQRRGLGISAKGPLYVTQIDPKSNAIVVGSRDDLYEDELTASGMNWIAIGGLKQAIELKAKIRYAHKEAEAVVTPLDEDRVHVKFKEPQMAIAPGQAIVLYDNDTVVGGGIIEKTGAGGIWAR